MFAKLTSTLEKLFAKREKEFQDVTVDEIRKSSMNLETEERRVEKDIQRAAEDHQKLLDEYALANKQGDQNKKKMLARKIRDIKFRQDSLDARHGIISRQIRTISGVLQLKENQAFMSRLSKGSVFANLKFSDVEAFVAKATRDQELQQQDMENLLETLEESVSSPSEDPELTRYMEELDQKVCVEEGQSDNIDQALDSLERHLDKELSETHTQKMDVVEA